MRVRTSEWGNKINTRDMGEEGGGEEGRAVRGQGKTSDKMFV